MSRIFWAAFFVWCVIIWSGGHAQDVATLTVDVARTGPEIPSTLFGIFFEDINHAVDGGLYAELVRNRSFEHFFNLEGWEIELDEGAWAEVRDINGLNEKNPTYLRIGINIGDQIVRVINLGYDGIPVMHGREYCLSLFARNAGISPVRLFIEVEGVNRSKCTTSGIFEVTESHWKRYSTLLSGVRDECHGQLVITAYGPGVVDLDMISFMPCDSWNGLRGDLLQMLAELTPGFIRFPGGCLVEGASIENAYRWKETIGPVETRPTKPNLWGYHQSFGIGFDEYFLLADLLGAEPVPIVNAGISCQVRGAQFVPLDKMTEWVQDALDLIEYARGLADRGWGAKQAKNLRSDPFSLHFLGIGNENWGPEYHRRFRLFQEAIKGRYPEIQLIFSAPPSFAGPTFDLAWRWAKENRIDIVDEHIYASPQWFLANVERYTLYDREGPKVMVGEFAAHTVGNRNNLEAALAEAAFMTGLERNSDVVVMASYAPLFGRFGWSQWAPNLIWFDGTQVYGTPSYYVQKLFSNNRGDVIIGSSLDIEEEIMNAPIRGRIGLGTWRTQIEVDYIKVTDENDNILLYEDFADEPVNWEPVSGRWITEGGLLKQLSRLPDRRLYLGDLDWAHYSVEIRVRKIGGDEGFLVFFGVQDANNYYWWNIGGWGNTASGVEKTVDGERMILGKTQPLTVRTGKWYHAKIEVFGNQIRCFLDGTLIHEIIDYARYKPLYHVCSYDYETADIIIKAVNPWAEDVKVRIVFVGNPELIGGRAYVLTSGSPRDENSFAEPYKVVPREIELPEVAEEFAFVFRRHSLTILRIRTQGI